MSFDHAAAPETEDPRKTLKAKSIHSRCAAARDLSRYGVPDDIPLLAARAGADRSPAVRLGTAGAAADILSRYRVGPRRDELSEAQRNALLDSFKGIDPSVNGGLFSLLACIGVPLGYQRIAMGLRDPRGDVRLAAAIGMLRLCASAAAQGDAELEAAVVGLLRDGKLKPDAAAEIAWVAARVGYVSARDAIGSLPLSGAQAELRDRAIAQLRAYEEPLRGPYFTDGRDAGEVNPDPAQPSGFAVFSDAGTIMGDGDDPAGWSYLDGVLPGGIRRLFIRRVGDAEPAPAFQLQTRTWYFADEARLLAAAHALARPDDLDWKARAASSPVEEHAPAIFSPWLPEGAAGDLARGLLLARAGQPDAALDALMSAAAVKQKCPAETRFFLGLALLARGQDEEGQTELRGFLRKARKKDPRRAVAEALL